MEQHQDGGKDNEKLSRRKILEGAGVLLGTAALGVVPVPNSRLNNSDKMTAIIIEEEAGKLVSILEKTGEIELVPASGRIVIFSDKTRSHAILDVSAKSPEKMRLLTGSGRFKLTIQRVVGSTIVETIDVARELDGRLTRMPAGQ